jgi:hypothetical protein
LDNIDEDSDYEETVSCCNAVVVLTEAFMEARDKKLPVFTCYMYTSKAFDMVDHQELLCAQHAQGLCGPIWRLFQDAYRGIRSMVKWQGQVSNDFLEGQVDPSAAAFSHNS